MSGRVLGGHTLARNTMLNILGMALPLLAALAAVPAISRGLGAARLGVLSLAWAVLGLFAEFGVGRATTKFVAEVLGAGERRRLAPIVWTTVAGQLAFGLLLGLAIALATPVLVGSALKVPAALVSEARTSFFLIGAAIPAILLASCFRGVLEAAQRFDLVNAIRVPTTLGNYLLPLLGVALGWGLPGVMVLLLASRLASVLAFWVAGWLVFPELRARPRLDVVELRRVLAFGGWTSVSSVASPMLIYVDRFILAALAGMSAVAYYAVPFELVNRLLIVPGAVAASLFPAFSSVSARGLAETDELASRGIKYILCLLGPLLVIIGAGAPDLLSLWIGAEYAQAGATALRLLAVGVAVNALAHVPHALLMGRGRPDVPAKLQLLELPLQLAVAWVLVGRYGVAGAAGAWLFRVALDACLLFVAARQLSVLSPGLLRHARLPQTGVLLAATAAAAAAVGVAHTLPWRLTFVAIATLAAAGTVWRLGLNQSDRAEVLRFLRLTSA